MKNNMGKRYLFIIGGTGHKLLRSVVHLAAAGVYGLDDILVKVIDSDRTNGLWTTTKNTLDRYREFYEAVGGNDNTICPKIEPMFGNDFFYELVGVNATMNTLFGIEHWGNIGDFAKFLFSETERNKPLDKGFYGRTNIGPIVIEHSINNSPDAGQRSFWDEVERVLGGQETNKEVILAGSVFGGMGASGIPVLLNKLVQLRSSEKNFGISLIACTPYFKFDQPQNSSKVAPNAGAFGAKVRAALKYYESERIFFDENIRNKYLYIIGESAGNYEEFKYSEGGQDQNNKACPIELFAATAINHRTTDTDRNGSIFTARRDQLDGRDIYTWDMLQRMNIPGTSGKNKNNSSNVAGKLFEMMKVVIVFKAILRKEIDKGECANGWIENYKLTGSLTSINKEKKEAITGYFDSFIAYFNELHLKNNITNNVLRTENNERVRLFNMDLVSKILKDDTTDVVIDGFEKIIQDARTSDNSNIYKKLKGGHIPDNAEYNVLIDRLLQSAGDNKTKIDIYKKDNIKRVPYVGNDTGTELQLTNNSTSGFWIRENNDALGEIAKGQNFSTNALTYEEFTVPTPWSAYMAYELILTDNLFSELNDYAVKTWRGLLTLIALRDEEPFRNKLNISISAPILSGDTALAIDTDGGGLEQNEKAFLLLINGMREPQNVIFKNNDKVRFSVVFNIPGNGVDQQGGQYVVTFLSDAILVNPVTNITEILKNCGINKFAPDLVDGNGFFKSADGFFKGSGFLRKKARSIMWYFLDALYNYLNNKCGSDSENQLLKTITTRVKEYKDVLDGTDILPMASTINANSINSPYNVFDDNNLVVTRNNDIEYPFILKDLTYTVTNPGGNVSELPVVLCGDNVRGVVRESADAYYHYVYANVLLSDKTDAHFTSGDHGVVYVLNTADLFEDTMIAFKNTSHKRYFCSEDFPNSLINNGYEIIFPLKNRVMDLFGKDISLLKNSLSVEHRGNSFIIKLKFRFHDDVYHTEQKKYDIAEPTLAMTARKGKAIAFDKDKFLPMLAVYPYMKITTNNSDENIWHKYYYFAGKNKYASLPRGVNDVISVLPYVKFARDGNLPLDEINAKEYTYYSSKEFPLALKITGTNQTDSAHRIEYGYVFVKQPEPTIQGIDNYTVAVDFGTTSSGVYYSVGGGSRYLQLGNEYGWPLQARTLQDKFICENRVDIAVQDLCSSEAFEADKSRYFVPELYCGQKSYLSAYETLRRGAKGTDNSLSDAFIYGRMLWQRYEDFQNSDTIARSSFSLKWGSEFEVTKKFLRQLFTHISHRLAIGGTLINWKFSYPTSMGIDRIQDFKRNVDDVLRNIQIDIPIAHNWNISDTSGNFISESIASARYFQKISNLGTFISVDIGGGSSDMAVYFEDRGIVQTSIKFASRDIFVPFLQKFLSENSDIFQDTNMQITTPMALRIKQYNEFRKNQNNQDTAQYMLETILFEFSDEIIQKYNVLRQINEDSPKKGSFACFTRNLMVGFSAILYYTAELLIATLLNDRGKEETSGVLRSPNNETNQKPYYFDLDLGKIKNITLGFCGKGSKILSWIGDPKRDAIIRATQMYIKGRINALKNDVPEYIADPVLIERIKQIPDDYTINFSLKFDDSTTKTETAQGLLLSEKIKPPRQIFLNADELFYVDTSKPKNEQSEEAFHAYSLRDSDDGIFKNLGTHTFTLKDAESATAFKRFIEEFYNDLIIEKELPTTDAREYRIDLSQIVPDLKLFFDEVYNDLIKLQKDAVGRIESTFVLAVKKLLTKL